MYDRKPNDRELNFFVSGMLWKRSLVMMDVETKSHWSHILGKAMQGELKDTSLETIPSDMLTWKAWLTAHPETTVLNMEPSARGFNTRMYRRPANFSLGWTEQSGKAFHARLDRMQESPLMNLTTGKSPVLLTFNQQSTAARLFSRHIDEQTLTFEIASENEIRDLETGSLWNPANGQAIDGPLKGKTLEQRVGIMSFTRAWTVFHPQSTSIKQPTQ